MNTPKIRFKGFKDAWEQRKLGEVSSKITKKNQDIVVDEVFTNSAEYGIISQRDFFDKDIANFENIDGYYIVEPNDFVYNPRISTTAPFGPIKRNKLERTGAMSPLYYVFRPHDIDLSYLECFFQTSCWHTFMRFNGNTGARSDRFAITDKVFDEMPISMPQDIEEQQKIGSYFSSLDNLITLHQRKCDETKQLKKFMLQKMFPKNGEKNPEIRFEGFTDDWEQRKFGDYNDLMTGYPFESDKFSEDGIKLVRGMNVKRGYLDFSGDICVKWNSCVGLENFLLKDGDILIQMDGALIGKSYAKIKENQLPALLVQRVTRARTNNKFASQDFMYQTIQRDFLRYIEMNKTETAVPHLSLNDIRNFEIMVPCLAEQKKIGEYFDSLDNLITLHQRKCEKLKELKKFMLQNMFV